MSATYKIYPDCALGVAFLKGTVDGTEIAQVIDSLYGDEHWEPGFSTVWDARGIQALLLLPEDLRLISSASTRKDERQGTGRLAGVVNRDLDMDLGQLIFALRKSSTRETDMFWSMEKAAEWLGIDHLPDELRSPI